MITNVTLTTKQLGLIQYALSSTSWAIKGEMQKGINIRDMPDKELRLTAYELGDMSELFKHLFNNASAYDMAEESKRNSYATQPKD